MTSQVGQARSRWSLGLPKSGGPLPISLELPQHEDNRSRHS
ncbi:hypothetical protein [Zooshikella ganghwensis]|nr:hypothetical protein [Zooshikella ganghwensis]